MTDEQPSRRFQDVGDAVNPQDIHIATERMLRIQGYTDPEQVRRPIRRAADQAAATVERLVEPDLRYRRIAVEACIGEQLRLAGGTTLHCAAFPRFLGSSTEIVVFVLTAGARIDAELARLNDEQLLLDMLFVETAGWLAVEEITKAFTRHLREAAKCEGLRITRRMGPGYSYPLPGGIVRWPLEEQQFLFALLDDANMPVSMLESCAMTPKMSRSGLIGLVPDEKRR